MALGYKSYDRYKDCGVARVEIDVSPVEDDVLHGENTELRTILLSSCVVEEDR